MWKLLLKGGLEEKFPFFMFPILLVGQRVKAGRDCFPISSFHRRTYDILILDTLDSCRSQKYLIIWSLFAWWPVLCIGPILSEKRWKCMYRRPHHRRDALSPNRHLMLENLKWILDFETLSPSRSLLPESSRCSHHRRGSRGSSCEDTHPVPTCLTGRGWIWAIRGRI